MDPMLDNGLGELGRHNASFEEDCIRSYHELEKKHKAEPRQYAGDQISRQLEYRKQEISKQVYFDEHLKDVGGCPCFVRWSCYVLWWLRTRDIVKTPLISS